MKEHLAKFNKWFNESEYPGSMRPYMWQAWQAWLEDMGELDAE